MRDDTGKHLMTWVELDVGTCIEALLQQVDMPEMMLEYV